MRLIKGNVERIAEGDQVNKLKASGFKELDPVSDKNRAAELKPLDGMTAQELKNMAREKGISGASSLTREELLEVLKGVV